MKTTEKSVNGTETDGGICAVAVPDAQAALDAVSADNERLTMALEMFIRDEKTAAQNVALLRNEIKRLKDAYEIQMRNLDAAEAKIERLLTALQDIAAFNHKNCSAKDVAIKALGEEK